MISNFVPKFRPKLILKIDCSKALSDLKNDLAEKDVLIGQLRKRLRTEERNQVPEIFFRGVSDRPLVPFLLLRPPFFPFILLGLPPCQLG
jgi:hypothetical protein